MLKTDVMNRLTLEKKKSDANDKPESQCNPSPIAINSTGFQILMLFLPWFTPVESFQPDHVLLEFVHEEGDSHSVDITRGWGERGIQVCLSIHPKHHRVRFGLQVPMQRPCIWRKKINGN